MNALISLAGETHRGYTHSWNKVSMRNSVIIALAALLALGAPVQAQSAREQLLDGKEMLEDAANQDDQDKLLEVRALFEQAINDDSLAILGHYYAASAASELANILWELDDSTHRRKVLEYVNYAIDHLKAATDRDEAFAEGWVMLAAAYGQKMTVRPLSAVFLGPRFSKAMSRARNIEPANPRVVLLKAITDYNLPGIVGGSKRRAVEGLHRATRLFADQVVADPILPSWGHDQAYARLGIAFMDQGDLESARTSFERALEINPDFGWVKHTLLPSLEELEAASVEN